MWRNCARAALLCCPVVIASSLSPIMLRAAIAGGDARHGQAICLQYCQGCHGPDGRGGGKGFMPHVGPHDTEGYRSTLPDEYLPHVIAEGGAAAMKSAFMPVWKTTVYQQDIAALFAFIRLL